MFSSRSFVIYGGGDKMVFKKFGQVKIIVPIKKK